MFIVTISIACLCISLVSLSGVFFTRGFLSQWMRSHISFLTSFALGVIAVLSAHLTFELLEADVSLLGLACVAGAGFVGLELLRMALPAHDNCEAAHDHSIEREHAHTPIDGKTVLVTDAVHNMTDGFILVPAFIAGPAVGIVTTLAIMIHESIQETSKFFILKESGYSDREALTYNYISALSVFVGALTGLFFMSSQMVTVVLTALAVGGFLSVIARDLGPHFVASLGHKATRSLHILACIAGIIVMLTATELTPHAPHYEETEHHETNTH